MTRAVVDAHADLFSKCVEDGLDWIDDAVRFDASAEKLVRGGVRVQVASVYVPMRKDGEEGTTEALRIVGAAEDAVRRTRGFRRVNSVEQLDAALASDAVAVVLGMEGAGPLLGDPDRLRLFARLGVRFLGLTHNHANACGDGCFAKDPVGLTPRGRDMVGVAEEEGVVLDAAHLNPRAFDDVLALAKRPVVCTHAGCRALLDVPRNLTDEQIESLAASGGVFGIDAFPGHVGRDRARGDLDDMVAHILHALEIAGEDHVGLGADFDGIPTKLSGFEDASCYPALFSALAARGVGEATLDKLAFGNWMRVLRSALERVPGSGRFPTRDCGLP